MLTTLPNKSYDTQSILAKMLLTLDPSNALHFQVEGFTKWSAFNTDTGVLCHYLVAQAIKHRHNNPTDKIVLLGSRFGNKDRVLHSILLDAHNNVIEDGNQQDKPGIYNHATGEYHLVKDNLLMYIKLRELTVAEFLDLPGKFQMNTQAKVVAKVDPTVLDNTLKLLYLVFAYITSEEDIPASVVQESKAWDAAATKLFTQFGLTKSLLGRLLKAARNSSAFTTALDQDAIDLGRELYNTRAMFEDDTTIPAEKVKMLKAFAGAFRNSSDTAFKFLEKNVSTLGTPSLTAIFTVGWHGGEAPVSSNDQKSIFNEIKKLTKKHLGTPSDKLSIADSTKLKELNPEAHKQYTKLRKQVNDVFKNFVRDYVRRSGKEYLPYEDVLAALKKAGIAYVLPEGFEGNIDENLGLRTQTGLLIEGTGATEVRMNPNYDPEQDNAYVFKAVTPGGTQNVYTLNYVANVRGKKKEEKVKDLSENLNKLRGKWLHDIASSGMSRKKILAAEVEIMYITGARTGNPGNATRDKETGELIPTYGITTLKVGHVVPEAGGYRIMYNGKKTSSQDHFILPKTPTNKKIIALITELMKDKNADDPLWTENGKPIPTLAVSNYFKSLGTTATLHKVRHILGTKLAREILEKTPLKKGKTTQSEAENWYKEALKEVGIALSHTTGHKPTSSTAIKSYIDPNLQKDFFTKTLGLRLPKWLQTKTN